MSFKTSPVTFLVMEALYPSPPPPSPFSYLSLSSSPSQKKDNYEKNPDTESLLHSYSICALLNWKLCSVIQNLNVRAKLQILCYKQEEMCGLNPGSPDFETTAPNHWTNAAQRRLEIALLLVGVTLTQY